MNKPEWIILGIIPILDNIPTYFFGHPYEEIPRATSDQVINARVQYAEYELPQYIWTMYIVQCTVHILYLNESVDSFDGNIGM